MNPDIMSPAELFSATSTNNTTQQSSLDPDIMSPQQLYQATQTPKDVSNAEQKLGDQQDNGYCETFVEQMTGSPNMGVSAAEAWNNYAKQGKAMQGLDGAKPGDKLYFYSPNKPNGHAAILMDKQGNIISNEGNGVVKDTINDFVKNTGQPLLGHVAQ